MAPERSRNISVDHDDNAVGRTQPSSVIALPRSSELLAGTVTQLPLVPAKVSAAPYFPDVVRVVLDAVPSLWAGDASSAVVPDGSSNPHAPTSPAGSTAGLLTVTCTTA